ncbi:hypothetical protein Taro_029005 [Colocasia esculenta]|uniref:Uncharacterized protein n=1 Tax=Colocasia esculenta TaxID=4460 RepID=A0A843VYY9_COLES|nr:hypothetical protein [Colocasia esculenta]
MDLRQCGPQGSSVGGGLEAVEVGRKNCLTDEAGFFRLRIVTPTMATRGRRGVGSSRGDESAGGSHAPAQQAQDHTGVPLPPPLPPVDYGALMQGLVHAMQTQAHTTTALQA